MSHLVEYSDSGSEIESDSDDKNCHKKIKLSSETADTKRLTTESNTIGTKLPLPDSIIKLFENEKEHEDDPSKHGGRLRTFAHEKGNWATLVYIPYEEDTHLTDMIAEILLCLRPLDFQSMEDFHISLSRTVSIRHHWIQSLKESLQSKISSLSGFPCEMTKLKLYTNDEKTRSFLAIEVTSPSKSLSRYVQAVDQCFDEFKLQKYYKDPSFHISIAWSIGDVISKITEQKMQELQNIWQSVCDENPELKYFYVQKVVCKTGNKMFHIDVTDT